jgi:outer membrane protein OmpA-like peptidoglycan-associated protein
MLSILRVCFVVALSVFCVSSAADDFSESSLELEEVTPRQGVEGFEPWVGLGLGFMDENEDLRTKGYPFNLKFIGSFNLIDSWVFDAGAGLVSQAFQNQSEKDIALSGLVDLGARIRFQQNWQAGPQLKTYIGEGDSFGSSSDIFTTFIGAQVMREQYLWGQYKTRAGLSLATDIGIPNQTAFVTSVEVQFALGGEKQVVSKPAPAREMQDLFSEKSVFFDLNQRSLARNARADLQKNMSVEEKIQAGEFRFLEVIGYADSTGSTGLNLKVSKDRAESVKRELMAIGVPQSKIRVRWVGESAAPRDQMNTQKLRKVEVRLVE